jgi:hypothetical protein
MVGGSFGIAATGAIFQAEAGGTAEAVTRDSFVNALSSAMWLSAGVAATGVLIALLLIRGRAHGRRAGEDTADHALAAGPAGA